MLSKKWRMPAEWYPHKCCWMLVPFRSDNWRQNAIPAQHAFLNVARAISMHEKVVLGVHPTIKQTFTELFIKQQEGCVSKGFGIELVDMEYDDCWMRDVGATILHNIQGHPDLDITIEDESLRNTAKQLNEASTPLIAMDWIFNAWGQKYSCWEHDDRIASSMASYMNSNENDSYVEKIRADFVLEGGSIHVDGEGTVLVTEECLLHPNRNPSLCKEQIEERLRLCLGVDVVIWLPRGLVADHDTNGHIDNIACFARPGVVLLSWTDNETDDMFPVCQEAMSVLTSSRDAQGRVLEVIKLPLPAPMFYTAEECSEVDAAGYEARQAGARMAGSYVNFYRANGAVVVPGFGQPMEDARAVAVLQTAFPDCAVVQVPGCREVLLGGGNIHCITQQQPLPLSAN